MDSGFVVSTAPMAISVVTTGMPQSSENSRSSALVRLGARAALARALGVEESRLQVVCGAGPAGRVPPEVLLDGDAAPADVSLSHHGRWLAWGIRLATRPGAESG